MFDDRTRSHLPTFEEYQIAIRGSFVIAAICKDGIILASESRANIFDRRDKNREPIAYYDGIQKVFPVRSAAIAATGQGLILNVFFSTIISHFAQSLRVTLGAKQLLPVFVSYCEQKLPPAAGSELKKQKLFSAGCVGGHPTICYFNQDQAGVPFGCIEDSGFIQSDVTLLAQYDTELPAMSAERVAELAIRAIKTYAAEGDRWKTIGGPIDVLLVSEDGCHWLHKNSLTVEWKCIQDLVAAYWAGELEITPIPPADRRQLEDLLGTVSEQGVGDAS